MLVVQIAELSRLYSHNKGRKTIFYLQGISGLTEEFRQRLWLSGAIRR